MAARKTRGSPPSGETPRTTEDTAPGAASDQAQGFTPIEEAAPITPSPHLLNDSHQRFCQEYIKDLSGPDAYQRTYAGCQRSTAYTESHRLLKDTQIRGQIQRLLDERATVTGITADRVLFRLWEQASADPRELVEVRVGSCRHCWGLYYQWQYTEGEWEKALSDHVHAERKRAKAEGDDFVPAKCPEKGGTGYSPNKPPNPDCPECFGDGEPRAIIKDQQALSGGALALFGGVKYDKNGNMTVIVRDQLPALRMVAEHLGLLSDKLPGPLVSDPLMALLEEIRGRHGAGSTLPIAHHDPEARPRQDVQDVQAKTAKPGAKPAGPSKGWRVTRQ